MKLVMRKVPPMEPFNRQRTVEIYKKLMGLRYAGAQYINATRKTNYRSEEVRNGLSYDIRQLKTAYITEIKNLSFRFALVREGRVFEKAHAVVPTGILDHDTRKGLLDSIKNSVRRIRSRNKYNGDVLANRPPNGILLRYQSEILSKRKAPNDTSEYVGIEIECVVPLHANMQALLPFAKWVDVGSDGSIRHNDNEDGKEIRVCVKREEMRTVIPGIMDALNKLGATVNKSCGLHVHLDQRHNDEPGKTFQNLVRSLGLLYTVVPKSRRENTYCKRNRRTAFASNDRYKAINSLAYQRYRTLEIRLFGGTLNAEKVLNWVETLEAIAHGEMVNRCPKNFDTARKYWPGLTDANVAWLKERQIQFAPLNQSAPLAESDAETTAINTEVYDMGVGDDQECRECGMNEADCGCEEFVTA